MIVDQIFCDDVGAASDFQKSTDGPFALTAAKCVLLQRKETRTHISHLTVH